MATPFAATLPAHLVFDDLENAVTPDIADLHPQLRRDLYGPMLDAAYDAGRFDGRHARGYMGQVFLDAYWNIVKWGQRPQLFVELLDETIDFRTRAKRGGVYSTSGQSKWLHKTLSEKHPDQRNSYYAAEWKLLESIFDNIITQLVNDTLWGDNRTTDRIYLLLDVDVWGFMCWYADPKNREKIYVP